MTRRPANFDATKHLDSIILGMHVTQDPLLFLDIHDAWDEVDWSQVPEWSKELRETEANLRQFRLRLEALHSSDRACPSCGAAVAGRADRVYCSTKCRVKAHRAG